MPEGYVTVSISRFSGRVLSRLGVPFIVTAISVCAFNLIPSLHEMLGLDQGARVPMEQAALITLWLTGAWLFNRLLTLAFWNGLVGHALGRNPPRLIIQLGGVIVFLVAISGIVRFVFGESVTAIWATSGAIGLVVGFALRNLILDTFSGLAIHLERPFKVGDWINCHTRMGPYIGRVEETNWRTTRLWTTGRNILIVPNSYLTTTLITNFSMPGTAARFEMDFVLDFSVPTERGAHFVCGPGFDHRSQGSNGVARTEGSGQRHHRIRRAIPHALFPGTR